MGRENGLRKTGTENRYGNGYGKWVQKWAHYVMKVFGQGVTYFAEMLEGVTIFVKKSYKILPIN